MNQYPPIPPLDPRQVKELVRQVRVLRHDYPGLSDEELAAEWAEVQRWKLGEGRPTPFAAWLAMDGWERGFKRAGEFAARLDDRSARQKALRQQAKDWKQDREPATPRQRRLIDKMVKERALPPVAEPASLSKLAARRLIQQGLGGPR